MNFLDPEEWRDLEALSKQYEELTDDLVKDLHVRLKPYFLRRIKSEVLQLPPKVLISVMLSREVAGLKLVVERGHRSCQHGFPAEGGLQVNPQCVYSYWYLFVH